MTVRLTIAQALAAENACDLIRDSMEADRRNKREASVYARTAKAIGKAARK